MTLRRASRFTAKGRRTASAPGRLRLIMEKAVSIRWRRPQAFWGKSSCIRLRQRPVTAPAKKGMREATLLPSPCEAECLHRAGASRRLAREKTATGSRAKRRKTATGSGAKRRCLCPFSDHVTAAWRSFERAIECAIFSAAPRDATTPRFPRPVVYRIFRPSGADKAQEQDRRESG